MSNTFIFQAEEGYKNLFGVDYSKKSIELSKSICEKDNLKAEFQVEQIKYFLNCMRLIFFLFKVMDVLDKSQYPTKKFDIAVDKGTYDAIGLCPEDPKLKRYAYKEFLCNILKKESIFIITSCNWTSAELIQFFTEEKGKEILVHDLLLNFSFL